MSRLKCYQLVIAAIFCAIAGNAHAAITVIGSWEGGNADGFIDWANQVPITDPSQTPGKYTFSSSTGVTIGASSLLVTFDGYNQGLAVKLQNVPMAGSPTGDERGAFIANRALAVDITYPAQNQPSGFQEIYEMDLNTEHYGYGSPLGAPVPGTFRGYGDGMGNAVPTSDQTLTLSYNYASQLDINGGPIVTSGTVDGWIEFVFATNGDTNHQQFYFDNFRFYTPGDMNNDGHVNAADIKAMELALTNAASYQSTYFNGNVNYVASDRALLGDINNDGVFNNADLQALQSYLIAGHGNAISVPEPASITLLALTGLALAAKCRRQRRNTIKM